MGDVTAWAAGEFGGAILGDARRTRRAVKIGATMAQGGTGSGQSLAVTSAEAKAAYRLFDTDMVTHDTITQHHRDRVVASARAKGAAVLFIHDDTLLDYSHRTSLAGDGPAGNGFGRGFYVHTCLASTADGTVIGLAQQAAWSRDEVQKTGNEKRSERNNRRTEAAVWEESVAAIGRCPTDKTWVSVGDRGADIYTHFETCTDLGWQCLVRMARDRALVDGGRVISKARSLAPMARRTSEVRGTDIELDVSWYSTEIKRPKIRSTKRRKLIACSVVRVWNDAKKIEWVLLSTLPVTTAAEAFEKVDWYRRRWLIEEFHKGIKTGYTIERSQLRTAERLIPLLGMVSVATVRLLQSRAEARLCPDGDAAEEAETIQILAMVIEQPVAAVRTKRGFARGLAQLGGFHGRKGDGEPGWQTMWRGWKMLQLILLGVSLAQNLRCG